MTIYVFDNMGLWREVDGKRLRIEGCASIKDALSVRTWRLHNRRGQKVGAATYKIEHYLEPATAPEYSFARYLSDQRSVPQWRPHYNDPATPRY